MKKRTDTGFTVVDWCICAGLALLGAVSFFPSLAGCTYPGEIANIVSVWLGLDVAPYDKFPLMALFAKPLGAGNFIAPVCGIAAALLLYGLVRGFVRAHIGGEHTAADAGAIARFGGATAAFVLLFTPAVIAASTHLEPRLFDAVWALAAFAVVAPFSEGEKTRFGWLRHVVAGVMAGMGAADTVAFVLLLPLFVAASWASSVRKEGKGYGSAALFIFAMAAAFFLWARPAVGDFSEYLSAQKASLSMYSAVPLWYVVPLFATVPFLVSLISARKSFAAERGWTMWSFHGLMTVVATLAVASALSPSSVMLPTHVPPAITSVFAAFTAGYVFAYWFGQTKMYIIQNESVADDSDGAERNRLARSVGLAAGGTFAAVVLIAALLNRFMSDAASRGAFADGVAEMLVGDLDGREWLVTDGTLDDHIRLAAHRMGKKVRLICLTRERDAKYIEALASAVEADNLGGDLVNKSLLDILRKYKGLDRKRLIPFIQRLMSAVPDVASRVAVFGAPDLWLYAGVEPVPELLFFGGDPARKGDWSRWKQLDGMLQAPKGWGSHELFREGDGGTADYLDRMRLNLRRHVGFVATDCGYSLQERGRKLQDAGDEPQALALYDKAFEMYELVLNEIDSDNICALFNEMELARARHRKAEAKLKSVTARLGRIKDDPSRRYSLGDLGLLYGYICNPDIILRYGLALLMKAGRPGDAVNQIRRAIEFVPEGSRSAAELNLLASIYASGAEREKARKIYGDALANDASNKTALLGLARLAMLEGDPEKAKEYLQKAVDAAGDDPAMRVHRALLFLLKGEMADAKATLLKVTDSDPGNMEAWSMLVSTVLRQADMLGDVSGDADKARQKKALESEVEEIILPAMEKHSDGPSDMHLLSARAMFLMHKGGDENIKTARDALLVIAKSRPDIVASGEMILSLDMRLNDEEDAERQAVETLAVDKTNPMANYILGSIALKKNSLDEAEAFLRVSADAPKPVVMALNDLAELLRRKKNYEEAEAYARKAVAVAPDLYVAWDTLGSILMDSGKRFDEAEQCIQKACDLSKDENGKLADVRMLISLARVQIRRGQTVRAKGTLRSVLGRIDELTEFEKQEFEELRKSAR